MKRSSTQTQLRMHESTSHHKEGRDTTKLSTARQPIFFGELEIANEVGKMAQVWKQGATSTRTPATNMDVLWKYNP